METSFYIILQLLIPFAAVRKINNDLQQPDTLTIAKGHSISLHCSYSMHNLSRFTVKWFLCNDSQYSSMIIANLSTDKPCISHSRYCVRHNSTLKAFILTIIDVQVSDNGIYCCEVIRLGPPPTLVFQGSGTLLNVTACPSLWLPESYDKISSSPSIIITCLAYGFYPNIIKFWIQPTCLTYRLISTSNPTNPNGTYNYTETFSISTENCSTSSEFTCIVQHPASQTELNGTIIIDVHTVAQDHKWRTWISILLSISGGTACLFLLVLFLIKCACKKKGIQEQTRIQSNRTLNLEWNNMNETNEEEICYAKLQWAMTRRARKEEEEETVYSPVFR